MRMVGQPKVWSFFDQRPRAREASNLNIRNSPGHLVSSYLELAQKMAELQYRNSDLILLFRGQSKDYRNADGRTTIRPTLFRPEASSQKEPTPRLLKERLSDLEKAGKILPGLFEQNFRLGRTNLIRRKLLRWAILQHYEVCKTPLLDVTHSLRIAASFASHGVKPGSEAYLMVLGVPHLSGGITVSAETGLQMIRLASICPPAAVRPHIQEGYLLSEYPEISEPEQLSHYRPSILDFGRRLVAKFTFDPGQLWRNKKSFPVVPKTDLYPTAQSDPLKSIADGVVKKLTST